MISKAQIQHVRSLQQKKFRQEHQKYVVEGPKLVDELLRSRFEPDALYATRSWIASGQWKDIYAGTPVEVTDKELMRISGLSTPNQVLAVVPVPKNEPLQASACSGLMLLLDGIGDPGNLGTMIRLADWYGIGHIICTPDCVELYNPKVVQAGMGSLFRVAVHYQDPTELLVDPNLKTEVFGAFLKGDNVYRTPLPENALLVIGSESHGIRPPLEPLIHRRLWIPPAAESAESLNAAVAAAVMISEFKRNFLAQV